MNLLEINANKLCEILRTNVDTGLKTEDVEKNRAEFSPRSRRTPKNFWTIFKDVFRDIMPWIFVSLSLIGMRLEGGGKSWFALTLFAVVYTFIKTAVSAYSSKVTKKLDSVSTRVRVIRGGKEETVDDTELVPGDIIILGVGDVVPCDALVLNQSTLRVSEIQLTGNSAPVVKLTQDDVLRGKGVPYYECIIFAGSVVLSGYAKALVCNTGEQVFDSKNRLTSRSKHARRTRIFSLASFIAKQSALIWILLSFFLFVVGALKGNGVFGVLHLATTLAVAALPDLFVTLFDLTVSVGMERLYKRGCIVRDASSIDRMCDISCVLVDNSRYFRSSSPKPSTVYVNNERKKFRGAFDDDVRELFELAVVASISNGEGMSYNGISVERSLIKCAEEIGMSQKTLYGRYFILQKRPFTEENGMSRVIVYKDSEFYIISLGSPSIILKTCSYAEINGETELLDERARRTVREISRVIARGNEGVVAVAIKKIEYQEGTEQIESNRGYSFKGYIGLHTSIKADSAHAVNLSVKSGIDVALMTAEGRSTSIAFAKSLSLIKDDSEVIDAKELSSIDEGLFRVNIKDYKIFVGLTPEQRAAVASYRKSDGDIIASTASSIEDLNLILESDVSFCPTDTTDEAVRQNSDVVINGSFELIPECIKYARSIYRNTAHMLQYLINFQFVLLFSTLLSMMFVSAPVYTPNSIMTYSILVSIPTAVAISMQRLRGDELKDNFGKQNLGISAQNLVLIPSICGFVSGVMIALSAKSAELMSLSRSEIGGSAFITLALSTVFMAFALSFDDITFASIKNRYLLISSVLSIGVMAIFVFARPFANLIGVSAPSGKSIALSIFIALVPALVCVGIKLVKKHFFDNKK